MWFDLYLVELFTSVISPLETSTSSSKVNQDLVFINLHMQTQLVPILQPSKKKDLLEETYFP